MATSASTRGLSNDVDGSAGKLRDGDGEIEGRGHVPHRLASPGGEVGHGEAEPGLEQAELRGVVEGVPGVEAAHAVGRDDQARHPEAQADRPKLCVVPSGTAEMPVLKLKVLPLLSVTFQMLFDSRNFT